MSKLTLIFVALFLFAAVFAAYQYGMNQSLIGMPVSSPEPSASVNTSSSMSGLPTQTAQPTQAPAASTPSQTFGTGEVSGKLCYPSEFLPAGKIIAKRLSDEKFFSKVYPGSGNGGGSTYTIGLEEGEYYLKYETNSGQNGYHTDVCPTGLETTCGEVKRENVKVLVKSEKTVSGFDLCDFYYQPAQEPKF